MLRVFPLFHARRAHSAEQNQADGLFSGTVKISPHSLQLRCMVINFLSSLLLVKGWAEQILKGSPIANGQEGQGAPLPHPRGEGKEIPFTIFFLTKKAAFVQLTAKRRNPKSNSAENHRSRRTTQGLTGSRRLRHHRRKIYG